MSEGLSRRRKIHGGHRGSATRMVHEIYEAIESTDERDSIVTKLEQCKISLEEKLEIIRQQDDEILELVGDEEVEHEIDEADTFSGRVRRAIIDATCAIEVKLVPTSTQVTVSNPTTTAETSAPSTEASTVAAATTSAATETPTGAAAAATTSATIPEVSETTPVSELTDTTTPGTVSTSSTAPPAPVFTIPTSSSTTGLPVIPPPIFSSLYFTQGQERRWLQWCHLMFQARFTRFKCWSFAQGETTQTNFKEV